MTKTVIFLTLTFMINWFPVHFLATWYRLDNDFPQYFSLYVIKLIAHTMSYANSFINPIIYYFANDMYKKSLEGIRNSIKRTSFCVRPPQSKAANERRSLLDRRMNKNWFYTVNFEFLSSNFILGYLILKSSLNAMSVNYKKNAVI